MSTHEKQTRSSASALASNRWIDHLVRVAASQPPPPPAVLRATSRAIRPGGSAHAA